MIRRAATLVLTLSAAAIAVSLAAGPVATASPAPAAKKAPAAPLLFDAVFTGTGSFTQDTVPTSISNTTSHVGADFSFTTKYSTTLFVPSSKLPIGGTGNVKTSKYSGKWSVSTSSPDADSCNASGAFAAVKGARAGYSGTRKKDGSWLITFSGLPGDALAESPLGAADCSTFQAGPDFWRDYLITSHVGGDSGSVVTVPVKVTLAELKKKSFVLPVTAPLGEIPDELCDGAEGCGQHYRWSGSIKFTRSKTVHA